MQSCREHDLIPAAAPPTLAYVFSAGLAPGGIVLTCEAPMYGHRGPVRLAALKTQSCVVLYVPKPRLQLLQYRLCNRPAEAAAAAIQSCDEPAHAAHRERAA